MDSPTKSSKWKSAWDLTERQKEKMEQKEKQKKKRKKSLISQGILEFINIGDPAVSSDNRHLKSFVNKPNNNNTLTKSNVRYFFIFNF